MRHIALFSFIVFFTSFTVSNLKVNDELKKINLAYKNNQHFQANVLINYYSDEKSTLPRESINGFILKDRDRYHAKYGNIEILNAENLTLTVDYKNKLVALQPFRNVNNRLDEPISPDSLGKLCTSSRILNDVGNLRSISLSLGSTEFSEVSITYRKIDYLIQMFRIHRRPKKGKAEEIISIEYKNLNTKPKFTVKDFSTSQFIKMSKNGYLLTNSFKAYKLLNYTFLKR